MQFGWNADGERDVLVVPVLPGTVLRSLALADESEPASQRVLPVAAVLGGSLALIAAAVVVFARGSGTEHAVAPPAPTVSEPKPIPSRHVAVHPPVAAKAAHATPQESALRRARVAARRLAAQLPVTIESSALLRSGSVVYVLGGRTRTDGTPSDGIWTIDVRTGRVTSVGQFIEPLTAAAAASLDGELYLAGGWTGEKLATGVLRWSPGHSSSLVTRLPLGMRDARAAFVGRTLYIVSADGADAFAVDVDTGSITRVAKVPRAVSGRPTNLAALAAAVRAVR